MGRRSLWQGYYMVKITGMKRVVDGIVKPRPLVGSHVPTGWPSLPPGDRGTAPSRGVRDGRRRGRRCGYIFFTGMSGITSSYWSREPPPPTTVTLMRHSGDLACTERQAPRHHPVRQGVRQEAPRDGRGGATGEYGEGLPGLCGTAGYGHLV